MSPASTPTAHPTPASATAADVVVDLAPGRVEQSLGVAALANGGVVAAVNAVDEDGGMSV